MRYETIPEAYQDLERMTGRLQLVDYAARLFEQTPTALLPTVALLCQGQFALDFTGVELGWPSGWPPARSASPPG